ncbi:MAG: hypothetical protein ABW201_11455 [Candidatus Thiodiazotropha sp.]
MLISIKIARLVPKNSAILIIFDSPSQVFNFNVNIGALMIEFKRSSQLMGALRTLSNEGFESNPAVSPIKKGAMGLHEVCGANGWAGIDSPAKAGSPLRGAFAMLGVLRRYAPCRTKGSNQILPHRQIKRGLTAPFYLAERQGFEPWEGY